MMRSHVRVFVSELLIRGFYFWMPDIYFFSSISNVARKSGGNNYTESLVVVQY